MKDFLVRQKHHGLHAGRNGNGILTTSIERILCTSSRSPAHNPGVDLLQSRAGRLSKWCGDGFASVRSLGTQWKESSRGTLIYPYSGHGYRLVLIGLIVSKGISSIGDSSLSAVNYSRHHWDGPLMCMAVL